jgi:spore germination protein
MYTRGVGPVSYQPKTKLWLSLVALVLSVGVAGMLIHHSHSARPGSQHIAGYVAYWDQDRGFASVERNLGVLSEVSPWWYALNQAGEVVPQHVGVTRIDSAVVASLQARRIRVIPTISNHRDGSWDTEVVSRVLGNPELTRAHIRSIVDLVVGQGYDGIDIDYENLRSTDRYFFSDFVRQLSTALRAHGRTLAVDLHPKTSDAGVDERNLAQDYAAIGAAADQVRIMAYDFHWASSAPGPVAPVKWVDEVVAWTATQVPKEKIVLGLPLLGYDWVAGSGEPVTWEEAQVRVALHRAGVHYDSGSQAPWFSYVDDAGREHTIWFEDARSIAAKLGLARSHGISGTFFWRLGGEDPQIWPLVRPSG